MSLSEKLGGDSQSPHRLSVVQPSLLVNDMGVAVSPWESRSCCGQVTRWLAALFVVTHTARPNNRLQLSGVPPQLVGNVKDAAN